MRLVRGLSIYLSYSSITYLEIVYSESKDGSENDVDSLSDHARTEYSRRQTLLTSQGVVDVALTAIATHLPNVEGNLADEVGYFRCGKLI
jgi:hypothetical protein